MRVDNPAFSIDLELFCALLAGSLYKASFMHYCSVLGIRWHVPSVHTCFLIGL